MAHCSHLVTFYFEEKFCVSARVGKSQLRDVYRSKAFRRPCWKNYISGYIWHKSFIQTVKCSFFDQIIVYQSFYGAPLSFSYFLLQGKVLCFARVGKSLARCLLSEAFRRPCRKNYISGYIRHKSFIQTVRCSFFNQIIVYQSFYGAPLTLSNFFYLLNVNSKVKWMNDQSVVLRIRNLWIKS